MKKSEWSHAPPAPGDWEYCRAVLPQVSRTFAINIRVLGRPLEEPVRIAYLLCRACDALEDSWPGTPLQIHERFLWLQAAVSGDAAAAARLAEGARALGATGADLALLEHLPTVLRCFGAFETMTRAVIDQTVWVMSRGMSQFAVRDGQRRAAGVGGAANSAGPPPRAYLDTEAELHQYCWVVAGCVGCMLTGLFELSARGDAPGGTAARLDRAEEHAQFERAKRLGEALQLTNILLDWPSDVRRGRCYIPSEWLAEHGMTPRDLVGAPHPGQRVILDRLERLARSALAVVPEYLSHLPAGAHRYRLFCLWPALWAAASIGRARREPQFPWGPQRPRLSRTRLWSLAAGSLLAPGAFSRAFRPPAT